MKKGVLAVVAASFLYGIMPMLTKLVMNTGLTDSRTVFYRVFFAAVASFIALKISGEKMSVEGGQLLRLAVFGTLGYGVTAALTAASYTMIPTGLATMFQFTYPLFVTAVMTLFFKEKLTLFKAVSCLRALAGLALMADFSHLSALGIALATLSGVTYASYIVANRKSSFRPLPGLVIVFYASLSSSVFAGARMLIVKQAALPSLKAAGILVIISVFCTVTSRYLLNRGIRLLGPSNASVLNMLEPVVSLIAGMIVYKEAVAFKGLAGCALVIAAGLLVALDSRNEPRKVKVHINTSRIG